MAYTINISGDSNESIVLIESQDGAVNTPSGEDIVVNTRVSNEVIDETLLLCQEITEKLNETEIVWNTSTTVPGFNTSMPTLRTTDTDIVDTSNVLADLVEIDEMWVDSILDNNQGFLSGNQCMCCNSPELYGTSYTRSINNVLKGANPRSLQMEKMPRAMHGFSSLLTMKKDGAVKCALYDFGANAAVLRENFASLKITELSLNDLIISHWHQDHTTDDLLDVIAFIYSINGNTPINLHFSGVDSSNCPSGIPGVIIPKNTTNRNGMKY